MKSTATLTVLKMLEGLPDSIQDRVVEHLRDYIEDMREEAQWTESFSQSQEKLGSMAQKARKDKAEGRTIRNQRITQRIAPRIASARPTSTFSPRYTTPRVRPLVVPQSCIVMTIFWQTSASLRVR